jgi:hypothetical protein
VLPNMRPHFLSHIPLLAQTLSLEPYDCILFILRFEIHSLRIMLHAPLASCPMLLRPPIVGSLKFLLLSIRIHSLWVYLVCNIPFVDCLQVSPSSLVVYVVDAIWLLGSCILLMSGYLLVCIFRWLLIC